MRAAGLAFAAALALGCDAPRGTPIDGRSGRCVFGVVGESVSFAGLDWGDVECIEYGRAWGLAVAEFGTPSGHWDVRFHRHIWPDIFGRLVSAETWPHGVIVLARNPFREDHFPSDKFDALPLRAQVCSTGLIHEIVHAGDGLRDPTHATWGQVGVPGSIFDRIEQTRKRCREPNP